MQQLRLMHSEKTGIIARDDSRYPSEGIKAGRENWKIARDFETQSQVLEKAGLKTFFKF
jgi:hypothetical protein